MGKVMSKEHRCPRCRLVVAKDNSVNRHKGGGLTPLNGASVTLAPNRLPRIKCPCGIVILLGRGSPS